MKKGELIYEHARAAVDHLPHNRSTLRYDIPGQIKKARLEFEAQLKRECARRGTDWREELKAHKERVSYRGGYYGTYIRKYKAPED